MRFNKKTAAICAFALGVTILAGSAFADTMIGSGFNSLKNSVKATTAKLTDDVDNFNVNFTVNAKVDNKIFAESIANKKYDIASQAEETSERNLRKGEVREYYLYRDENQTIYKNFDDGSYNVYEKRKKNNDNAKLIEDPFEEERVKDLEKVLDAFVGSLEDVIQVEESGGKKMYTGNLSESQMPSLVNAITSFAFKYSILDEWNAKNMDVPYPKSNIYLINASGKAIENEEGIVESGIFTASISAQDEKGVEHIYSLDFSIDIKDINNTVVKAPNFDGQKVTYNKENYEFNSKHIGKYKNDIVIDGGSSFEKVGERFIEITSVEGDNVKGKYYEVYNEGYEAEVVRSFDFYSDNKESTNLIIVHYKNDTGEDEKGILEQSTIQNIRALFNADIDIQEDGSGYSYSNTPFEKGFDENFIRIFE